MLFHQLSASDVLQVRAFDELEAFRAAERFIDGESIPLRIKSFSAARATLALPRSTLVLIGSFPRILDGAYSKADPIVTLIASPPNSAIINGIPVKSSSIGIVRGRSRYSMFEKAPNWYFSMRFDPSVDGRGWPKVMDDFALFKASPQAISALREVLAGIFMSASGSFGDALAAGALASMEETMLSALDQVFTGEKVKLVDQHPSALHLRLIQQIDLRLASNPSETIYSKELAHELGVSVRSLHTAANSIRGMSLHRYLKVKRLWLVRRRLLSAEPGAKIKSFALAHGFWHLGDFSSDYHLLFGELPSATLARAGAGAGAV